LGIGDWGLGTGDWELVACRKFIRFTSSLIQLSNETYNFGLCF